MKHAGASKASIRLVYSYPDIILRIEDDGQGFDLAQTMEAASHKFQFQELDDAFRLMRTKEGGIIKPLILF